MLLRTILVNPRESKMQESSREKKCGERTSLKKVKRDAVTLGDHRSAKASIPTKTCHREMKATDS